MTTYQNQMLKLRFQAKPYLDKHERDQLATSLNVSKKKMNQWYLKRRYEEGIRLKGEECSMKYS